MRAIAAASLILMPLSAAASQPQPRPAPSAAARPGCDRFARMERTDGLVQRRQPPRAERLDRLPPADLRLTVERTIGGCRIPVIVRQNFVGGR
jgi:hypothetical protein